MQHSKFSHANFIMFQKKTSVHTFFILITLVKTQLLHTEGLWAESRNLLWLIHCTVHPLSVHYILMMCSESLHCHNMYYADIWHSFSLRIQTGCFLVICASVVNFQSTVHTVNMCITWVHLRSSWGAVEDLTTHIAEYWATACTLCMLKVGN